MALEKLLEETPETYYWIGFLMADGCFVKKSNNIVLSIAKKDTDHIIAFCKFLNINKYRTPTSGGIVSASKADKINFKKVVDKFNVLTRKTYNPPEKLNIINDDLFISFMTGYIDGDGCIHKRKDNGIITLRIACHSSWENSLNKWFYRLWQISKTEAYNSNTKIPICKINKEGYATISSSSHNFLWFLKNEIERLNIPYLKRKWNNITMSNGWYQKSFELKNKIMQLFNDLRSMKEISNILNISNGYICDTIHQNLNLLNEQRKEEYNLLNGHFKRKRKLL